MAEYTDFNGDPQSYQPQSTVDDPIVPGLDPDVFAHDPACDSPETQDPETQERDEMGRNGTEIKKATPSGPASSESQVQNPVSGAQKWEEVGNHGNERENFSPISPACSSPQASDSEPSADEDDSESTYPELLRSILEFLGSGEDEPESADKDVVPLTARQLSALPYLAAFPNANQAARAAGVGKTTLYRWLEEDNFREELTRLREEAAQFARQELKGLQLRAVDVIRDALNHSNVEVRLRAARYSMSYSTKVDLAEKLKQDIDHLEIAVAEWMSRRPMA